MERVKVEATETFTFKDYDKVEIITKRGNKPNEFQRGDTFICDEETAMYLSGKNPLKKKVVDVLEIMPYGEITYHTEDEKLELGVKMTPAKKKSTKKSKKANVTKE